MMKKGFTLLEALIAISIVLIAISASFSIVPQGQIAINRLRDRTTATYLAQEAIEVVRHQRDNGMYFQSDWFGEEELLACRSDAGLDPLKKCVVDATVSPDSDPNSGQLVLCPGGECDPVLFKEDGDNGVLYGNFSSPFGAEETKFTRWVTVEIVPNPLAAEWQLQAQLTGVADGEFTVAEEIEDNIEVRVSAHVEWEEGLNTREIVVKENLFNWLK